MALSCPMKEQGHWTFSGGEPLGDVIDAQLAGGGNAGPICGRLLRYMRDSRRLDPARTYCILMSVSDFPLDEIALSDLGIAWIVELP